MSDEPKEGQQTVADLTLEVLRQIRDEVHSTNERLEELRGDTNERLDAMTERLDATNERLDATNERLDRHEEVLIQLVQGQTRHERALGKLVDEVQALGARFDNFLTGSHQRSHQEISDRVAALSDRVGRLEERLGQTG
jgi:predicted nuclease with TOPRIM domain